ncbi:4-hydroxythreonine-4-phosphate dehydrogenase PdxA [Psychrobacter sp. I-STPA6b]|uniref:4-hydroxythreonine-4-phosphate dehydrogenase PdxA n=1 Tax=Psychrobacter sp. I-STPA6b TaxID=2585718 RepID=UPI001D0C7570|nr:4-hydroxythreonine-4-phosphate dehydrogenase PdxA [Psychrobacter sp. I-STPA6b]
MKNNDRPLVITTGEPAGIGMDIVLQLASTAQLQQCKRPICVLADKDALYQRAQMLYEQGALPQIPTWQMLELDSSLNTDMINADINKAICTQSNAKNAAFYLLHVPCAVAVQAGQLAVANADMVAKQLQIAHTLASQKMVAGIVTAPLQKSVLIDANIRLKDGTMFTGHTEYFMQQSGCDKVVMMLANDAMRVALVTTHLPLRQVADAITTTNVQQTVSIVLADLQQKFAIDRPRILVCGLNPHAGEGGHLGQEEIEIINPVLTQFQKQGVDISLAMPADTLFTSRHLQHCDAVIAMYHDQGLPVLKSHGFGDTVNLTLGLPYIRTSVDHGTALDLAGTGQASASSLWQAIKTADEMATRSQQ